MSSAFSGKTGRPPSERPVAALTNAELARLIGTKIGSALNDDDRRLAYEAQIKALESGSPGAPMPWRNPASGRYGNIVPGPPTTARARSAGAIPIRSPLVASSRSPAAPPAAARTASGRAIGVGLNAVIPRLG